MRPTIHALIVAVTTALLAPPAALAAERLQVVASFSILADMIDNVGGEHVAVTALVGPDSDAHVFSPRPRDVRTVATADLVVFNGLQFEGWMTRLIDASGQDRAPVIATAGLPPERLEIDDHDDHQGHDEHDHGGVDPHAWQDLTLARTYVANIRDGLIAADPAHADAYAANATRYLEALAAADAELHDLLDDLPASALAVTGHDSFGHFARAYGVRFRSPAGVSTEGDTAARDLARLIDTLRETPVVALFHENMTSPAMLEQLAQETGLPIAGTLYADALAAEGEASTYLGMMRHNAATLHDALARPGHDDDEGHDHSH